MMNKKQFEAFIERIENIINEFTKRIVINNMDIKNERQMLSLLKEIERKFNCNNDEMILLVEILFSPIEDEIIH